jgi:hypothetical protein
MAREASKLLDTGDTFPNLRFNLANGENMVVPQDLGNRWRVLLTLRGNW